MNTRFFVYYTSWRHLVDNAVFLLAACQSVVAHHAAHLVLPILLLLLLSDLIMDVLLLKEYSLLLGETCGCVLALAGVAVK